MPAQDPNTPYHLACTEVWGGNLKAAHELELPGLACYVYSTPYEFTAGGDVYYLSACSNGVLARIALADVSGHGETVSTVGSLLRQLMHRYINTWDQSALMQEINREFPQQARGGEYATAVLLGYYSETGQLLFSNAGHPPPLWYRAAQGTWQFLPKDTPAPAAGIANVPLGLIPETSYCQNVVEIQPGDFLVLYTDAFLEAASASGEELGLEGLLALASAGSAASPSELAQGLLSGLARFRDGRAPGDDETLVVLQRRRR